MDTTLQKLERLIAEIGGAPIDDQGTIHRLNSALDEVGARLREYLARESAPAVSPATSRVFPLSL